MCPRGGKTCRTAVRHCNCRDDSGEHIRILAHPGICKCRRIVSNSSLRLVVPPLSAARRVESPGIHAAARQRPETAVEPLEALLCSITASTISSPGEAPERLSIWRIAPELLENEVEDISIVFGTPEDVLDQKTGEGCIKLRPIAQLRPLRLDFPSERQHARDQRGITWTTKQFLSNGAAITTASSG